MRRLLNQALVNKWNPAEAKKERRDIDGAEAAYRAAIAADPGHSDAHFNLGILLKKERRDIDGAVVA